MLESALPWGFEYGPPGKADDGNDDGDDDDDGDEDDGAG